MKQLTEKQELALAHLETTYRKQLLPLPWEYFAAGIAQGVKEEREDNQRFVEDYIRLRELWKMAPCDVGFLRVAYPDVGDFKRAFDGWLRKQGVDIDAALAAAIRNQEEGK